MSSDAQASNVPYYPPIQALSELPASLVTYVLNEGKELALRYESTCSATCCALAAVGFSRGALHKSASCQPKVPIMALRGLLADAIVQVTKALDPAIFSIPLLSQFR